MFFAKLLRIIMLRVFCSALNTSFLDNLLGCTSELLTELVN